LDLPASARFDVNLKTPTDGEAWRSVNLGYGGDQGCLPAVDGPVAETVASSIFIRRKLISIAMLDSGFPGA
jgi:hypothetical protein